MIPEWAIRTKADKRAIKMGCYWDEKKAQAIIDFAHKWFHTQYRSGTFRLHEWQEQFLRSIEGWRLPSGKRRFRFVNLHISKKAGKTMLMAVIALFNLFQSSEISPVILIGAASKDNAKQAYDEVVHSLALSGLSDYAHETPHKKHIFVKDLNANLSVVSSDGSRLNGPNANIVILDECFCHKNTSLFDAVVSAGKDRDDFICILCSTAGDNAGRHWYFDIYLKSKRILSGDEEDILHGAWVYEATSEDNVDDPETWRKANPSPFDEDLFRLDMESKKSVPHLYNNWRRQFLNIWVRPDETAWIDVSNWDTHALEVSEETLLKLECTLGFDPSLTQDPTSVSMCWDLGDRNYYFRSWAFVCDEGINMRNKSLLPKYTEWIEAGEMETTSGNMIDTVRVREFMLELCDKYRPRSCNFDPSAGGNVIMQDIEASGWTVQAFPQTYTHFNGTMREFEAAYMQGRIKHPPGQGWMRYCLSNVRIANNTTGMIRPLKKAHVDKTDAAISALCSFITHVNESDQTQVYIGNE